jgi:hypothetical protein
LSVAQGCGEEAIAVAKASNARLMSAIPSSTSENWAVKLPMRIPQCCWTCEVDAIKGAMPRLGTPLGIATPVNDTVIGIITARERRMLAQSAERGMVRKKNPPV